MSKGQIFRDGVAFELRPHARERQQRLDFGSDEETAIMARVIKRLNPHPIARAKEPPAPAVPDGKPEHAAQVVDAFLAVLFIEMNNGLGIAVGAVAMAARLQAGPQLGVVINLAVKNNPNRAIFVAEGLMSGLYVHDTQPAHGDADVAVEISPRIVRTAMHDLAIHGFEGFGPHSLVAIKVVNGANAAHSPP